MRAWLFQDSRQKQKLGDACPWSVGWYDPEGKKCSKRVGCKSRAEKFARRIEGQLAAGTYEGTNHKKWADFRTEYEKKILPRLAADSQRLTKTALDHFERLVKPVKLIGIKTQTIDDFVAKRKADRGKKPGSKVSPATVNRDLRHLKSVLRIAHDWGLLPKVPKFRRLRESEQIGPVITQDHFQLLYEACNQATQPEGAAADFWKALLVFAITTGWRISEILHFRREDLDLETGAIKTRARDNKGNRDDLDYLPAVALEHVRKIVSFSPYVFNWPLAKEDLYAEFKRLQKAAGVNLPCQHEGEHECTEACHYYGFHALRRGYATLNADTMSALVLQRKMRHKSITTTQRYIQLADKMKKAADEVYVPEFLRAVN